MHSSAPTLVSSPSTPPTRGIHAVVHRGPSISGCLLVGMALPNTPSGGPLRREDLIGYHFFHLHQLSDQTPENGDWCVCYEDNTLEAVGTGQRDLHNRISASDYGWYQGTEINWFYVGRRILATTDPELIARGLPALSEEQVSKFKGTVSLHPLQPQF